MSTQPRIRKHRTTYEHGNVRRISVNGREKLAFPITPLREMVYQYPEWGRAEYLPGEQLVESAPRWSDTPVFVDHPDSFAANTTRSDPDAFEDAVLGRGYQPEIIDHQHDDGDTSKKLRIGEARVDIEVAKEIGGAVWETVRRLDNGQVVSVSPGYATVGDTEENGSYRGEEYSVRQGVIKPDHIALVPPGERARCTPQQGCAAPRMNALGSMSSDQDSIPAALATPDSEVANDMSTTDSGSNDHENENENDHDHDHDHARRSADTTSALVGAYHRLVDAVASTDRSAADNGHVADEHLHAADCTYSGPGDTCSCGLHVDGEHPEGVDPEHRRHADMSDISRGTWVSWGDTADYSQPLGIVRETYDEDETVPESAFKGSTSQTGPAAVIATYEETDDGWRLKDGNFDDGEERVAHQVGSLTVIDSPLDSRENTAPDAGAGVSAGTGADGNTEAATDRDGTDDSSGDTDDTIAADDSASTPTPADATPSDADSESSTNTNQQRNDTTTEDTEQPMTEDENSDDSADDVNDRLQKIAEATAFSVDDLENMSDEQVSVIATGADLAVEDADSDDSDQDTIDADMQTATGDDEQDDPTGVQTTGADSTSNPSAADAGPADAADAERVHALESRIDELEDQAERINELEQENQELREKVEAPENAARAQARQHVSEHFGVDPESLEGMDDDALAEMAQQTGLEINGSQFSNQRANGVGVSLGGDQRANTMPPSMQRDSPSADMRGVGGETVGSESSDEDGTEREHTTDRDGYGDNGYPAKGREAWRARNGE